MTFGEMSKYAADVLRKLANDKRIGPRDTLCVICSRSGKYYHGLSKTENQNGTTQVIGAEKAALGMMVSEGETAVATLLLVDANTQKPLMPSKENVNYLFVINADNVNGKVLFPDKEVRLSEIGDTPAAPPAAAAPEAPKKPKKNLLLDRVNSLMDGVDDDDEEDEEILEELDKSKKKKKRFGLF